MATSVTQDGDLQECAKQMAMAIADNSGTKQIQESEDRIGMFKGP